MEWSFLQRGRSIKGNDNNSFFAPRAPRQHTALILPFSFRTNERGLQIHAFFSLADRLKKYTINSFVWCFKLSSFSKQPLEILKAKLHVGSKSSQRIKF
jgi:hypothetical protein